MNRIRIKKNKTSEGQQTLELVPTGKDKDDDIYFNPDDYPDIDLEPTPEKLRKEYMGNRNLRLKVISIPNID